MAGIIDKGYISKILPDTDWNGHPCKATLNPCTNSGAITPALTIPWYLRGQMGSLKVGDCVAYALFDDGSGVIIDRLDGEWTGVIDYPTKTTGDVVHEKNVTTQGNTAIKGDTEITGKAKAADLETNSVGSYNDHTHTGVHGETSGPHG